MCNNNKFYKTIFQHGLKKIRNGVLSSGIKDFHTRRLQTSKGYIEWRHWVDAYHWDQMQPFRLYYKLTESHIFPDKSEKMRNHLAEETLDSNMLFLMKVKLKQYNNMELATMRLGPSQILLLHD